jgi:hypothetical protein
MNRITNFDYNGTPIFKRADGYINLTQMCQANGKKLSHFFSLKSTKAYISCIESEAGFPASEIIDIVKGGNPSLQGSWGHPEIAIALAQWISPQFHRWCNAHIFLLMDTGSTSLAVDPLEEMKLRMEMIKLERDLELQKEKTAIAKEKATESEGKLITLKTDLNRHFPEDYQVVIEGKPLSEVKKLSHAIETKIELHSPQSQQGISLTELLYELNCERSKTGKFSEKTRKQIKSLLKEFGVDLDTGIGTVRNEIVVSQNAIPKSRKNELINKLNPVLHQLNPNVFIRSIENLFDN